ncbi:MAG: 30S ribosomal protein S18 [Bdellovibrionales bacterium]|jgi:small subunit ribosomal protein S6|nr:30S ribosomal protein S18 [Bdellovibrionales bacterium]
MIYEIAIVAKDDLNESQLKDVSMMIHEVAKAYDGEVTIEDDWGSLKLAQPTSNGSDRGRYLYFQYKANNLANVEIARRIRISEGILRHLIVRLGEDADLDKISKAYKTPFSKKYKGSVTDSIESEGEINLEKDRKKFARGRACWFKAKSVTADWKDPKTYQWLMNEFGKISPARVSSISRKHQRFANAAIKRARNIGLASIFTNRIASER